MLPKGTPVERSEEATNGAGDRIDALGRELERTNRTLRRLVTRVEYAASSADNATIAAREVAGQHGQLLAELAMLNRAVGHWPKGPDDKGSGLLGAAARGSFTNEADGDAPTGLTGWPAAKGFASRHRRPLAVAGAILGALGALYQALQGF